jgi:hypothetical protein
VRKTCESRKYSSFVRVCNLMTPSSETSGWRMTEIFAAVQCGCKSNHVSIGAAPVREREIGILARLFFTCRIRRYTVSHCQDRDKDSCEVECPRIWAYTAVWWLRFLFDRKRERVEKLRGCNGAGEIGAHLVPFRFQNLTMTFQIIGVFLLLR